jgi:hypothetical protein
MQEWFVCEEGKEAEAAKVQDKVCRERLKDMYSEAHIQCVISYHHEVLGQKVTKKQAREMIMLPDTDITREQYMQVSRKHLLCFLP